MQLPSRHRRTLEAIFARPTRGSIRWSDIEALFEACGAKVAEGVGSRVRILLGDQVRTFHPLHPGKEAKKYAVEAARDFLAAPGIEPL